MNNMLNDDQEVKDDRYNFKQESSTIFVDNEHSIDMSTSFEWIFHFIDLIYVTTVYSMGNLLHHCGAEESMVMIVVSAYFFIMFSVRRQFDAYASTYKIISNSNEAPRILLFLCYCLCVFCMTVNIALSFDTYGKKHKHGDANFGKCKLSEANGIGFAWSYVSMKACMMLLYFCVYKFPSENLKIAFEDKEKTKLYFQWMAVQGLITAASVLCMSFILGGYRPIQPLIAVACVEIVGDFIGETMLKLPQELMPEPHHFQERLGLMFMLVLGETIIHFALTVTAFPIEKTKAIYVVLIAGFCWVITIGMQFFERAQDKPHANVHNRDELHPLLHRHKIFYALFVLLHAVICFCLFCATDAMVHVYLSFLESVVNGPPRDDFRDDGDDFYYNYYLQEAKDNEEPQRRTVTIAIVFMWFTMLCMELLHPVYRKQLLAKRGQKISNHKAAKKMFTAKVFAMAAQVILYLNIGEYQSGEFIGYTALIAGFPSVVDWTIMFTRYFNVKGKVVRALSRSTNGIALSELVHDK